MWAGGLTWRPVTLRADHLRARTRQRTLRRTTRPDRCGAPARHPAARAAWPPSEAAPGLRRPRSRRRRSAHAPGQPVHASARPAARTLQPPPRPATPEPHRRRRPADWLARPRARVRPVGSARASERPRAAKTPPSRPRRHGPVPGRPTARAPRQPPHRVPAPPPPGATPAGRGRVRDRSPRPAPGAPPGALAARPTGTQPNAPGDGGTAPAFRSPATRPLRRPPRPRSESRAARRRARPVRGRRPVRPRPPATASACRRGAPRAGADSSPRSAPGLRSALALPAPPPARIRPPTGWGSALAAARAAPADCPWSRLGRDLVPAHPAEPERPSATAHARPRSASPGPRALEAPEAAHQARARRTSAQHARPEAAGPRTPAPARTPDPATARHRPQPEAALSPLLPRVGSAPPTRPRTDRAYPRRAARTRFRARRAAEPQATQGDRAAARTAGAGRRRPAPSLIPLRRPGSPAYLALSQSRTRAAPTCPPPPHRAPPVPTRVRISDPRSGRRAPHAPAGVPGASASAWIAPACPSPPERKPQRHTQTNLARTAGRSDSCAMRLANFDLVDPRPLGDLRVSASPGERGGVISARTAVLHPGL